MTNLENFPNNEIAKKMLKTVSPIYEESYVAKWMFEIYGIEMSDARKRFEELRAQAFIETATWGIKYWEQRYHIESDESLPISQRRNQVIVKRGIKAPMNPFNMERLIFGYIGVQSRVEENIAPYTFKIWMSSLPENVDEETVKAYVRRIKPSHLSFFIGYEQAVSCDMTSGGIFTFAKTFSMKEVG